MHWWIILVLVGFNLLCLFADLRFIYFYMHTDDYRYNQGIFAQLIALIGVQIVWLLCCLLPTDVYNTQYDGGLGMLHFWQLVYLFVCVYLTLILPFSVFFYEADSDTRITKTPPWRKALISTAYVAVGSWSVISLLYLISHTVKIPVTRLDCVSWSSDESGVCSTWEKVQTVEKGNLAFLTFLIALPGFFGWLLLIFQGGVGLASLPLALLQTFISRPRPITLQQYERLKKILGERATVLRKVGETLKKKEEAIRLSSGLSRAGQRIKFRQRMSKYKQVVVLLENEYDLLEVAYHKRGMNPIKAYATLMAGMFAMLLTIAWLVQVMMCILVPQMTHKKPPFWLMSSALKKLNQTKVLAADLMLYALLCGYFVLSSLHGNIRISLRIQSCLPMQPLRRADTHMNALLFHIALCILSTTAVIQLSHEAFASYAVDTDAETIFTLQRFYVKLFSNFYEGNVFIWMTFCVCILAFIWLSIFPQERPAYNINDPQTIAKWERLQRELGVNEDGTEQMKELADEMTPEAGAAGGENAKPSLGERAKARLARIDNKIERAPAQFFSAGFKQAAANATTG